MSDEYKELRTNALYEIASLPEQERTIGLKLRDVAQFSKKNTPTSSKAHKGKSHNEVVNGTNQDKLKHSRNGIKRPAN